MHGAIVFEAQIFVGVGFNKLIDDGGGEFWILVAVTDLHKIGVGDNGDAQPTSNEADECSPLAVGDWPIRRGIRAALFFWAGCATGQ